MTGEGGLGHRCPILGFALCLLLRLMHDVEGGGCIILQNCRMFLPPQAHIPCFSTENFIPSCSSHSCSCNADSFVSNGAVLAALFMNFYASRHLPSKLADFGKKNVFAP